MSYGRAVGQTIAIAHCRDLTSLRRRALKNVTTKSELGCCVKARAWQRSLAGNAGDAPTDQPHTTTTVCNVINNFAEVQRVVSESY